MIASHLVHTDEAKDAAVRDLERQFNLNTDQLKRVAELLQSEMRTGLKVCDINCNVPMLPSWITRHPTGQEKGEYMGLDLSGKYAIWHVCITSIVLTCLQVRIFAFTLLHSMAKAVSQHASSSTLSEKTWRWDPSATSLILWQSAWMPFWHLSIEVIARTLFLLVCASLFLFIKPLFAMLTSCAGPRISKSLVLITKTWLSFCKLLSASAKFLSLSRLLSMVLVSVLYKIESQMYLIKADLFSLLAGCLLAHSYRSLDTLLACTVSTGTNAGMYCEDLKYSCSSNITWNQ